MHVVYNSFNGRFSDNPRAIYERLRDRPGTEHTWLLDPAHAAAFPDGRPHRRDRLPRRPRGPRVRRPGRRRHAHRGGVDQVRRDDVPPDLARHPAQADPLRRAAGAAGPARLPRPGRRPLGRAALPQPGEHAAAAEGVRLRRAGLGDRLPAQRPAAGPGRRPGARRASAPSWGSPTTSGRCSTPRPGATTRSTTRASTDVPMHLHLGALAARLDAARTPHKVLARLHNMMTDRLARRGGARGGRRVVLPRRRRALPRRRRAGHRLLVGDVRLRAHRASRSCSTPTTWTGSATRSAGSTSTWSRRPRAGACGPRTSWSTRCCTSTRRAWAERYAAFRSTYGGLEDGHATDRVLERLGLLSASG